MTNEEKTVGMTETLENETLEKLEEVADEVDDITVHKVDASQGTPEEAEGLIAEVKKEVQEKATKAVEAIVDMQEEPETVETAKELSDEQLEQLAQYMERRAEAKKMLFSEPKEAATVEAVKEKPAPRKRTHKTVRQGMAMHQAIRKGKRGEPATNYGSNPKMNERRGQFKIHDDRPINNV